MLFNSMDFIVFLLVVYCTYLVLPFRLQNYMLLAASYIFYGWWDVRFLFLVALSTTVDFWVGLMLEHGKLSRRERLLPAAFLCHSAVVFLGTDPGALWFAAERPLALVHLIRIPEVAWAFAGSIVFLVIMQFLYRGLQSLGHERRRIPTLMVSITTQIGLLYIVIFLAIPI